MQSFPKVKLVAVGKVKKKWVCDGLAAYLKRLPELEIREIKDSNPSKEGEQVLSSLKASDCLIALTETGETLSSRKFAHWLGQVSSNTLVFVIGSADGLSPQLRQRAARQLSLSPMTFTHEVARLLLVEQLYRAKTILQGGNYHK